MKISSLSRKFARWRSPFVWWNCWLFDGWAKIYPFTGVVGSSCAAYWHVYTFFRMANAFATNRDVFFHFERHDFSRKKNHIVIVFLYSNNSTENTPLNGESTMKLNLSAMIRFGDLFSRTDILISLKSQMHHSHHINSCRTHNVEVLFQF